MVVKVEGQEAEEGNLCTKWLKTLWIVQMPKLCTVKWIFSLAATDFFSCVVADQNDKYISTTLEPNLVILIQAEQYLILVSLPAGSSSRTVDKGWWHVCFHMCWMPQLISAECLWSSLVAIENCPSKWFSEHCSKEQGHSPGQHSSSCHRTSLRLHLYLWNCTAWAKGLAWSCPAFLPRDWAYFAHFGSVFHLEVHWRHDSQWSSWPY